MMTTTSADTNTVTFNANAIVNAPETLAIMFPPKNPTGAVFTVSGMAHGNGDYTISASSEFSGRLAYYAYGGGTWQNGAFRFSGGTGAFTAGTGLAGVPYIGEYVAISIPVGIRVHWYQFNTSGISQRNPKAWKIYARMGVTYPWVELDSRAHGQNGLDARVVGLFTFTLPEPTSDFYTEIAMVIGEIIHPLVGGSGTPYVSLSNLRFYGSHRFADNAVVVNGPVYVAERLRCSYIENDLIVPNSGTLQTRGNLETSGSLQVNGNFFAKMIGGVTNVKAYGAIGDGITSDTAAVSSALNALNALGGGTLYMPKGVYNVGGMGVGNNVRVVGDGVGNTIIRCMPVPSGSQSGILLAGRGQNILIQDLEIDGNRDASGVAGHGIRGAGGVNLAIRNVKISRASGYGIGFQDDFKYDRVTLMFT